MIGNRFAAGCASTVAVKAASAFATTPSAWAQYPYPGLTYTSDGGPVPAADPTMITKLDYPKQGQTTWAMYATGNQSYISLNDRVKFYRAGVDPPYQPWWANYNASIDWAPDVRWNPSAGKFYMYYSVSSWGSQNSAIGLAMSSSGLPGTWIDTGGPILTSSYGPPGYRWNAIDPHFFHEGNRAWLTYGSFEDGIFTVAADPATGRPAGSPVRLVYHIHDHWIEGADLIRWGQYYYLFFSHGACCEGFRSNYDVRVGRSSSPTGPFYDKQGRPLDGWPSGGQYGGSLVLSSHDWVRAPGGQNLHWDPWDRELFMLYHYWDTRYPESRGRVFGINRIRFDGSGWPCWC